MNLDDLIARKKRIVEERVMYYIWPRRCPVCEAIVAWIVARGGGVTCGAICGREMAKATRIAQAMERARRRLTAQILNEPDNLPRE